MREIIAIGLFAIPMLSWGQWTHVEFFDPHGELVDEIDSAGYFVAWDYRQRKGLVVSNYLNPVSVRFKSSPMELSGDHLRTYYYRNGKMKAVSRFRTSSATGPGKSFYMNGAIQGEFIFPDRKSNKDKKDNKVPATRIVNYWDSLGNQMVRNGNGMCICNVAPFDEDRHIETGEIRDSVKVGTWTGISMRGEMRYEEIYNAGTLVSGKSSYKGGQFEYTDAFIGAAPKKDMVAFYRHVGTVMRYPANARRLGLEGTVYVQFMILEDGSLSQIKVAEGFDAECDLEAMRAVSSSPKWEPGYNRGRKVKQRYTVPIHFKLG